MLKNRKRGPIPKIELPAYRVALKAVMQGPWSAREISRALGRSERAVVSDMATLIREQEQAA